LEDAKFIIPIIKIKRIITMTKSLADYVAYYKPTYEFVIKSRFEPSKEGLDAFYQETDNKYELITKSDVKRNKFGVDKDFPDAEGILETWEITVKYGYPVIDRILEEVYGRTFGVNTSGFKIRKSKSAQVLDNQPKELQDAKVLLWDNPDTVPLKDIPANELSGDEYNTNMVKELRSKEFKDKFEKTKEYEVKDEKLKQVK